jgi:predicted MFS family arabinose efflux permease
MVQPPRRIVPVIIISQLAGASLWFAGNAVLPDLQRSLALPDSFGGHMTAAVQLGFIAGTLVFAALAISDRYSPRTTLLVCSLLGAACNAVTYFLEGNSSLLITARFGAGFFLAGIYPVGMKIASGWYRRDLGMALGFLVGALVLGTALPHLIRGLDQALPWQTVMLSVSAIAAFGGLLLYALVPDGPLLVAGAKFDPRSLATIFRSSGFRASSFGYFGHMWELYAFCAFVPPILAAYTAQTADASFNISLLAFAVIAAGAIGSAVGGYLSLRVGSARVAFAQLAASGLCCLLSPLMFFAGPMLFLPFLLFWGVVVARLAAVLGAERALCTRRSGGVGADHCQLHRFRHLDRQHPAPEQRGRHHPGTSSVPAAGAWSDLRPVVATSAAVQDDVKPHTVIPTSMIARGAGPRMPK